MNMRCYAEVLTFTERKELFSCLTQKFGTPCFSRGTTRETGEFHSLKRQIDDFDGRISRALTGLATLSHHTVPAQAPDAREALALRAGDGQEFGPRRATGNRRRERREGKRTVGEGGGTGEGREGREEKRGTEEVEECRASSVGTSAEDQHDLRGHLCHHTSQQPGGTGGETRGWLVKMALTT